MKKRNLLTTSILLILALIVIPVAAVFYDEALNDLQMNILKNLVYAMLAVSAACFVLGEITKNYSQTDKLWSIMPFFYVLYAACAGGGQPRPVLMAILAGICGKRPNEH